MARHWTNHITSTPQGGWAIIAMEWELDFDGSYGLSDVDEPSLSAGRTFPTASAAFRFAEERGIRVSNWNHIS